MANRLYPKAKEGFLSGNINLLTDTVKVTLVTSGYTYGAGHQYMNTDTVSAASKVATVTLASGKAVTNGVFDAADVIFPTVSGSACSAMIIWVDGGGGGTSASGTDDLLVAYLDTVTGLPVTPNGGDIEHAWDSGASKIFAL